MDRGRRGEGKVVMKAWARDLCKSSMGIPSRTSLREDSIPPAEGRVPGRMSSGGRLPHLGGKIGGNDIKRLEAESVAGREEPGDQGHLKERNDDWLGGSIQTAKPTAISGQRRMGTGSDQKSRRARHRLKNSKRLERLTESFPPILSTREREKRTTSDFGEARAGSVAYKWGLPIDSRRSDRGRYSTTQKKKKPGGEKTRPSKRQNCSLGRRQMRKSTNPSRRSTIKKKEIRRPAYRSKGMKSQRQTGGD